MPGFDRSGPQGQGPMTGGGRGFCLLPRGQEGDGGVYRPRLGMAFRRGMRGMGRRGGW